MGDAVVVESDEGYLGAPQLGPDRGQGFVHPVLDRYGMNPVEGEEASQQIVLRQPPVDEVTGRLPGHEGQGPFQAGAIKLDEETDQRLGPLVNGGIRFRSELGQELFDPETDLVQILSHVAPRAWRRIPGGGCPPGILGPIR